MTFRIFAFNALVFLAAATARAELPDHLKPPEKKIVEDWPAFIMSMGVLYAPAPWIKGKDGGGEREDKLHDQAGPRFAMEWRLADYLLLGGVFDITGADGSILFEGGVRLGAIVPIDTDWCLYGMGSAVGGIWVTEAPDRVSAAETGYLGWGTGLSLGFRFRFSEWVGTFFELTGSANRYTARSKPEGFDCYLEPWLLRLEMTAGVTFDWTRAIRSPAAAGRARP